MRYCRARYVNYIYVEIFTCFIHIILWNEEKENVIVGDDVKNDVWYLRSYSL